MLEHWEENLIKSLCHQVKDDAFWKKYLKPLQSTGRANYKIHLAILVEPYFSYILSGKKTIESRFSSKRFAPYNQIGKGDVIILKKSGGPVAGICLASDIWFYEVSPKSLFEIKREFARAICPKNSDFWKQREKTSFATLIELKNVNRIKPIIIKKNDRRPWVVLNKYLQKTL